MLLGNAPFLIVSALIVISYAFAGTPERIGGMAYGLTGFVRTMTTSTLIGATLGSVFWFVALRGREDAVST